MPPEEKDSQTLLTAIDRSAEQKFAKTNQRTAVMEIAYIDDTPSIC
jgi:hypothetical protein